MGKAKYDENRYYEVCAKCGHVGKGKYCLKRFYTIAPSMHKARENVLKAPRVKKQLSNPIEYVCQITKEEYEKGRFEMDTDPYFNCKCEEDQINMWRSGYQLRTYYLPDVQEKKARIRSKKAKMKKKKA